MTSLAVLILAAHLAFQEGTPLPRLGTVGQRLTDAHVAELERLAAAAGGRPWLMVGDEAFTPPPRSWFVDIYLAPDVTTDQLRRGRIQTAVSQGTASGTDRKPWRLQASALWAQVAVRGRAFEEPARIFTDVEGGWPVGRIHRASDGTVEVVLFESEHVGQMVSVIRTHGLGSSPV